MAVSHAWSGANDGRKRMAIEEEVDARLYNAAPIVDPSETERIVEQLRTFSVDEVGSTAWMEQHRNVERLNLQAHQSALGNSDEYVLEALLTFDKLDFLVHDLLVIEAWKENVYPCLLDRVAGRNTMRVYFVLYHEATIVNLLEVLLYHKHICEAGGELMLELVDYCARKLTRLQSGYDFRQHSPEALPSSGGGGDKEAAAKAAGEAARALSEKITQRSPQEELAQYLTEIEFKVCISACSLARFLCEHADAMPLSVASRISDTHDLLVLLVPLIENPPWTRRLDSGKWQKLVDFKWTEVKIIDLLKITKLEGQPWLALYHLLAKEVFRERYHLNSFRKAQVLRVRKYLNEVMLDQLPFLADIMRYLDELAITEVPESASGGIGTGGGVFMFQQVAVRREALLKGQNWEQVADKQMAQVFTMTDRDDPSLKLMADVYSDDLAEDTLEGAV
jgi:hypothetical protein